MIGRSVVLVASVAALCTFGCASSMPVLENVLRAHPACSGTDDFATDNYEACPVHDSNFNITASCESIEAKVAFTVDCTLLESECDASSGCCDYQAVLFEGSALSDDEQGDFVSDFVALCQQTRYDSTAAAEDAHVAIAAGEGDFSEEIKECEPVYVGTPVVGDQCLKKRKFKHAVKRLGNHLIDTVPKSEVNTFMTELMSEATKSGNLRCLDYDDSITAGVEVAALIEAHAEPEAFKVLAQTEDPCCHPLCYNLFDSARGTKHETLLGSASVAFEIIARKCCDIVRVDDATCPTTSPLMVGY